MFALIRRTLRDERKLLLLIPLLLAMDTLAQSALPLIMSALINASVDQGGLSTEIAAGMLALIVSSCVLSIALCRLSIRTTQACQNRLRKKAYDHMLQLSPMQVKQYSLGELLTRIMSDSSIVVDFIMQSIFVLVKPLLLIVMGVVLLMRVHLKTLEVIWIILPVQLLLLVITLRRMLPYFGRIQGHVEKLNSYMKDSMDSIRLIKAYTCEEAQAEGFHAKNSELYDTSCSIQLWTAMLNPVVMLLMNLGSLLLLLVCSRLLLRNEVDAGGVMAAFAYIQQIFMSLMALGEFFPNISRARISSRRLLVFFDTQPAVGEGEESVPDRPLHLRMENVGYRFSAEAAEVLRDVSLDIPPATQMAIAGGTGSGKTTLLRLLCRMMDATDGRILIEGRTIGDYRTESLYDQIQLVEQSCHLYADTLANNIRCGMDATQEDVMQAAKTAQLEPLIQSLPNGLETFMSESSASLSGGQRQCIAIARALLRKPRVLLMDDCSSSMDLEMEHRLMNELLADDSGRTLVVVSQRVSTLKRFDTIAMLDDGRLICLGGHDAMLQGCIAYRQLCGAQKTEEDRL